MRRPLILVLALSSAVLAHFHAVIPDKTRIAKGERVSFLLFWGHPYEHAVMPSAPPLSIRAIAPDGSSIDLAASLEAEGDLWRFAFEAPGRGDYQVVLRFAPVFVPEEQLFWADTVRLNIHVQVQQGWHQQLGGLDIIPLTRPYGLRPGVPFRFQVRHDGHPTAGQEVEVERYHPKPPARLPDEVFITGVERCDTQGQAQAWLPEAGFWSVTAARATDRALEHEGARYPVEERVTYWLQVEE